ncbi:MAG: HAMP domain-containing sensor histidine kinase [Ferruginibacter sp.]
MPVRIKITLFFTLIMFLLILLFCGIIFYFSYTNRLDNIKTHLTNRTLTTASLLSQPKIFDSTIISKIDATTREITAITNESIQAYNQLNKRIYAYSDIPDESIQISNDILNEAKLKTTYFFTVGDKEAIARYYSADKLVIIAAAYDADGRSDLHRIKIILYVCFTGIILIAFASGWFFSKKLLQPIRKIADEINVISAQSLKLRIKSGNANDEWNYLTKTLNDLLNRLQEGFEVQTRFISSASHELSTPLTSISSQLEVSLQRDRVAEDYRKVMQSVYQDVRHLNKLTQTLLEFAKASGTAGGIEIDLIRIDEILMRLPGEMIKFDEHYSVKLEFDQLPEDAERLVVFGNAELLFAAIKNIVSNACKFSVNGLAIVKLSVDKTTIIISIKDEGKGISENDLTNIFQPFFRTEDSRGITGFGVGLPLVHRIIKLHNGQIDVNSIVGKGTTFIIELPTATDSKQKLTF